MALPAELTLATVPGLLDEADALAAAGTLDLAPVRRADSAGIAFLLEITRRARGRGTALALQGAGEQLRSLATFFGVEAALNFLP